MTKTTRFRVDSTTPCCDTPVRLLATQPAQSYVRTCSRCGQRWLVDRGERKVFTEGELAGATADAVGWHKLT